MSLILSHNKSTYPVRKVSIPSTQINLISLSSDVESIVITPTFSADVTFTTQTDKTPNTLFMISSVSCLSSSLQNFWLSRPDKIKSFLMRYALREQVFVDLSCSFRNYEIPYGNNYYHPTLYSCSNSNTFPQGTANSKSVKEDSIPQSDGILFTQVVTFSR